MTFTIRQPWTCPRCERVCAPHLDHCDCQPQPAVVPTVWPAPTFPGPQVEPTTPVTPNIPWGTTITLCGVAT